MTVDDELCETLGLDPKQVASIARRLSKAAREAESIGLTVFGGSGSGNLRFDAAPMQGPGHSEVATLDGTFDGGAGGDIFG